MLRVTMEQYETAADCPFRDVLDHISGKWCFMVIAVLEDGPHRFNEIKRTVGDISQRVLTQTLRELERDGFVKRTVVDDRPLKVVYELTGLGRSLIDPIKQFVGWAADAHEEIKEARAAYDERVG